MNHASTDHPVHELVSGRWSPYGYDDRPVDPRDLRSLFEAARCAPSCFNEQPWRFIVTRREDAAEHERALECLVDANRAWAQRAPVLVLAVSRRTFARNDKPNGWHLHDLGLAVANLCIEATARDLCVHQMAGVELDKVRAAFDIPEEFEPHTAFTIGYPAPSPDADVKEKDAERRPRHPQDAFVFGARWGEAAKF